MYFLCFLICFIFYNEHLYVMDLEGNDVNSNIRLLYVFIFSLLWFFTLPFFIIVKYFGGNNNEQ